MRLDVEVTVDAPRADVWRVVADIENAATTISGIEEIEVLERPGSGILGLKWKETRTLFGKTATEVMWITEVDEGSHYLTEARSHGSIYRTRIYLAEEGQGTRLGMEFVAEPQSLVAKVLSLILSPMMKGAMRKTVLKDLQDIKAVAEG